MGITQGMGLRLRWVKIHQFRDVAPGTELHFSDGWNVIVGRNGTGKTTLLELVSAILQGVIGRWRKEVFEFEALVGRDSDDDWQCTIIARSTHSPIVFGLPEEPDSSLEVRLQFGENNHAKTVLLRSGEHPVAAGFEVHKTIASWTTWWDLPVWLTLLHEEGGNDMAEHYNTERLDEGIAYFGSLTGRGNQDGLLPIYSIPYVVSVEGSLVGVSTPPGFSFLLGNNSVPQSPSISLEPILDNIGKRLCPLVQAQSLIGTAIEKSPRRYGDFSFYFVRNGNRHHHDAWSFGQKRLFAFYWYLARNPDVFVADELVNGFHWEWIDACVKEIGDRQVFVTAQNPLLLDHIEVSSAEQAKKTFVMCRAEKDADGKRLLRWTQPDDRQAQDFMEAYNVGIQYVSEILKTQGLW